MSGTITEPLDPQATASAEAIERVIAEVAHAAEGSSDFADAAGRVVAAALLFLAEATPDREQLRHVEDVELFGMVVSSALLTVELTPVAPPPDDMPTSRFEEEWRAVWGRLPGYARTPSAAVSILARLVYGAADDPGEAGVVVAMLLRRLAVELGVGHRPLKAPGAR